METYPCKGCLVLAVCTKYALCSKAQPTWVSNKEFDHELKKGLCPMCGNKMEETGSGSSQCSICSLRVLAARI